MSVSGTSRPFGGAVAAAAAAPTGISGNHPQSEANIRVSNALMRHCAHATEYLQLIKAYEAQNSEDQTTLKVTRGGGLFLNTLTLQHDLPPANTATSTFTCKVPESLLPGCKVGDTLTIKKNGNNYDISFDGKKQFTLIIESDGVHLHEYVYADDQICSERRDGIDHAKNILDAIEKGDHALASKTLLACAAKLSDTALAKICAASVVKAVASVDFSGGAHSASAMSKEEALNSELRDGIDHALASKTLIDCTAKLATETYEASMAKAVASYDASMAKAVASVDFSFDGAHSASAMSKEKALNPGDPSVIRKNNRTFDPINALSQATSPLTNSVGESVGAGNEKSAGIDSDNAQFTSQESNVMLQQIMDSISKLLQKPEEG